MTRPSRSKVVVRRYVINVQLLQSTEPMGEVVSPSITNAPKNFKGMFGAGVIPSWSKIVLCH